MRDIQLLGSALAAPRATFGGGFLHTTLPEMAAAYLFHIVRNHPFVDGNKRAGLAAAIAFLGLNDLWLGADEGEVAELVKQGTIDTSLHLENRSRPEMGVPSLHCRTT